MFQFPPLRTLARSLRRVVVWLVLSALLVSLAGPALAERVALVIGNGSYQNANALPNPPKDAEAIAEKLEELDFRVTRATDADLATMRAALADFGEQAQGAEVAVIFYAGHGLQVDGENYLLPVDARLASRADLPAATLRASDIYQELLDAAPELAVLVLDACRDNPFVSAVSTSAGLASGSVSASAFVQRPDSAGMLIGFAAAPGAVAFDGGDGNSPYTTALLKWIDRPGLEVSTMFRRVRVTVLELTRGAQVPWVEEALLREVYLRPAGPDTLIAETTESVELALLQTMRALEHRIEQEAAQEFYERLTGDAADGLVTQAALTTEAAEPGDEFVRQGLIWLSIRRSPDIELLERFVSAFPDSPFTSLALDRIAALQEPVAPEPVAELDLTQPQDAAPVPPPAQPPAEVADAGAAEEPSAELDLRAEVQPEPAADPAAIEAGLELDAAARAAVQAMLADAGHYTGAMDAIFGPGTRGAIAGFQSAEGLPETGHLDAATLDALVRRSAGRLLRARPDPARRDAIHRVAAIAERGAAAEPTVLRVAALSRNDAVHEYWQELTAAFEADHPGTRVLIEHQPDWSYKANLLGMLGSETPPDIIHTWGGGHLDALRDAGFVRDLGDEMAEGWAMEFRPGALGNFTRDGRIFGAPTYVALVSLWANAAILEDAGIPLAQLETWDGFIEAVRTLKARGVVPVAVGGRDHWPFQLIWGNLAQQIGGRAAFEAAYAGEGDGFQAPAFVEASERLRELADLEPFQDGFLGMDEAAAGNAFARGETAMVITGNWRLHSMRWNWPGGLVRMRQEIRRLDFPRLAQAERGPQTYGGVDGYAVNVQAPDIALDLVRLLTSPEVQARTSELTYAVPSVSGSDLALADPFIADVADALLTSTYHQLYYDQALGPFAGEVVNEVAMKLGTGAIGGREAAREIDAAWNRALLERDGPGPALPDAARP